MQVLVLLVLLVVRYCRAGKARLGPSWGKGGDKPYIHYQMLGRLQWSILWSACAPGVAAGAEALAPEHRAPKSKDPENPRTPSQVWAGIRRLSFLSRKIHPKACNLQIGCGCLLLAELLWGRAIGMDQQRTRSVLLLHEHGKSIPVRGKRGGKKLCVCA